MPWGEGEATFEPVDENGDIRPWAVVVFVVEDGRFLISRVPRGWCTPSGRVEQGESPEEAAVREVHEETGARLADLRKLGRFVVRFPDGRRDAAFVYLGHVARMDPIPAGSEASATAWFGVEELPRVYWHWDPLMEAMFQYAKSRSSETDG